MMRQTGNLESRVCPAKERAASLVNLASDRSLSLMRTNPMIDVAWLRALGPDGVERLLHRRPDVVFVPEPHSLAELAERLTSPWSVVAALRLLNRPTLQAAEALAGLGGKATESDLARLLGSPRPEALEHALSTLHDHALLSRGLNLALVEAATAAWPSPLGLGPPVAQTLHHRTVDQLKKLASHLRITAPARRADLLAAVTTALCDPGLIRELVDSAPEAVRAELLRVCHTGEPIDLQSYLWYSARDQRQQATTGSWGLERGLLTGSEDGTGLVLVAEAALALRGSTYAAPFEPDPPPVPATKIDQRIVDSGGVAAIASFRQSMTAVHDAAGRKPIAILKAGGIGTRELKRLAKETGCPDTVVRLALTLGYHMKLWDVTDQGVAPTGDYDDWLAADPAQQLADLIQAVWAMPQIPLGEEGTWHPLHVELVPALRQRVLAEVPANAAVLDAGALASAVAWRYPYSLGDPDSARHFVEAAWREMELTGIVAAGATTSAGKALRAGEDVAATLTAVGSAQRHARFGTDLTAVVTGTPAAGLIALLDTAADRESRSTASSWRFSPSSVRRALDAGHAADDLVSRLSKASTGPLPQPLDYLIRDEARRHGSIRARAVASCLRGDDQALMRRLAADRKLVALQLRLLAPTVVVSAKSVEETLAALRLAGYSPMPEDADGVIIIRADKPTRAVTHEDSSASAGRRTTPAAHVPKVTSLAKLAKRLISAPDTAPPPQNPLLRDIQAHARGLTQTEMRLLAHAISTGHPVTISYVNRQGNQTIREIEDLELTGSELIAWCRLRDELRYFNLGRILAVQPA
jgi:hypothetical protein